MWSLPGMWSGAGWNTDNMDEMDQLNSTDDGWFEIPKRMEEV
jgi:hypothetical protein